MGDTTDGQLEEQVRRELAHLTEEEAIELARILGKLVERFQPERIYVFGSQARGDITPNSDVDLLIVMSKTDQPRYRLAQDAYRAMGSHRHLSVDVIVMDREEFERRARAAASLPATVLREGKMLYAA